MLQLEFSYYTVLKYCSIIYQYDVKHLENLRWESFQGVLLIGIRYIATHRLCITQYYSDIIFWSFPCQERMWKHTLTSFSHFKKKTSVSVGW